MGRDKRVGPLIRADEKLFSTRALVRLIIPLIIEQSLAILVGMCDGIMVSSVGEAAISGVSLVDMINNVVLNLFAALATGGAVVTSQYLGARNRNAARDSAGQLVTMALFFGLLVMGASLLFSRGLLKLFFGAIADDVMAAGLVYFRITALSFPFIALYNAGAAIFRSVGNSKLSMKVSMLMNLLNVGGNALCIYGLKMGVAGVAVPTLVSRAVAAVVILGLASGKGQELAISRGNLLPLRPKMMGKILHIGIPSAFENSLFQLGRVIVVSMIALFGTSQTSANAVANNLDAVGVIIGQAMSLAMVTVVGRCIGAGDTEQATFYAKKLMKWAYLYQGALNIVLMIFVGPLIGLYKSLSPETVALARILVLTHQGFAVLLWPASFVLPNALRAANDVRFTMAVSIASMAILRVGASWLLCVHFGMGAVGVWIAMVLDWICRTAFFVGRMVGGKWKTKYALG